MVQPGKNTNGLLEWFPKSTHLRTTGTESSRTTPRTSVVRAEQLEVDWRPLPLNGSADQLGRPHTPQHRDRQEHGPPGMFGQNAPCRWGRL
jgi:hypothetical protein